MQNLIQLSEQLKAVPDQYLEQQVQMPTGEVPPYLVLSELNRRKALRSQMAEPPVSTVAQDVLQQQPMQPQPGMPQPGMQPGMGSMGSMDLLGGQQFQPQMPQMPQGGMPMGGGLAAMAPPMPPGPPAPQRMARGGLIGDGKDRVLGKPDGYWGEHALLRMADGGGVSGAPGFGGVGSGTRFVEEKKPWWQDMLKMYGMTGGLTGLGAPVISMLLSRWFDKRDKQSAALPPATTTPKAMAGGGVIRMAAGSGVGLGGVRSRYPRLYEDDENPYSGVVRDPATGGWTVTLKGQRFPIAPRPKFEFPEWEDPEPIKVPEPDIGGFLEQVRALNARPAGEVNPLDRRISELEEQRGKIRRPTLGDALMETGLGMMASKSQYPLQALGEAGSAALQNRFGRQMIADQTERGITDRLAGIALTRDEQLQREKREDLRAASELASRQYGANMVEAQARAQQQSGHRTWDLERFKAERDADLDAWKLETGLEGKIIDSAMRPETASPYQEHLWDLEEIDRRGANEARAAAIRAKNNAYGRTLAQWKVKSIADELLMGEAEAGWQVRPGETPEQLIDRQAEYLADQVETFSPHRLQQYPDLTDIDRQLIAAELRRWQLDKRPGAGARGHQAYRDQVDRYIKAHPAPAAAATTDGYGTEVVMPRSKSGQQPLIYQPRYPTRQ